MKKVFKIIATLFFVFAIVVLMLPGIVSAADSASSVYPTSINGLPVILVETPANDINIPSGHATLVLLDTTSVTVGESVKKLDLKSYLINNPLQTNISFEVYGGPGVTAQQIISLQKKYSLIQLGSISPQVSPNYTNVSFQICMNNDAWNPNSNLNMQACNIIAPATTNNYPYTWQNQYTYFGDNVRTDGNYFLQSGQYYGGINYNGQDYLVWADDSTNSLQAQPFDMQYTPGNNYTHSIFYWGPGNNGYQEWGMMCFNCTTSDWAYHIEQNAFGTVLGAYDDTDVFFENHNTNTQWYQAFNVSTVQANTAYEGGSPVPWSSSTNLDYGSGAMSGYLQNSGTLTINLSKVPVPW
jgi:hypothetical protein